MKKKLTYAQTGVNYDVMDFLKRLAQVEGKKTARNLHDKKLKEIFTSRGESAYVSDAGSSCLAFVVEGLGTKSLVADAMYKITGRTYYDSLAQDTVAMIVNDLITVGARPATVLAYWATGSSSWFDNKKRMEDLVKGWKNACDLAGASWGGGETPTLTGIIEKESVDLAGACFGMVKKDELMLGEKLKVGDSIILFESSGIHANGLTLARKIAEKLPRGYVTKISSGKMYGEALLEPTIIYAKLINSLIKEKIDIHYMVNITGHGWRKLMRYTKPFTHRITKIPPVPPILQFMIEKGPIEGKEAYGNLNMGAGFAIFVPIKDVGKVISVSKKLNIKAYNAGVVEKGKKQVIILSKNIIFEGESLKVRI